MYTKGVFAEQKSYGFWNLKNFVTRMHKIQNHYMMDDFLIFVHELHEYEAFF